MIFLETAGNGPESWLVLVFIRQAKAFCLMNVGVSSEARGRGCVWPKIGASSGILAENLRPGSQRQFKIQGSKFKTGPSGIILNVES
ncbi:hypothetical protein [Thioalkalivibrio sulfidiphilus]|uniref:hypothetical protein n=1 Tax=Thioalkalivibrio sulfidiphilus TaxID=1033854 RepID=UPI0012DBE13E|nr:hypothetical protein [Thioalkalivibrio sulfidiphilus]